MQQMDITLIGLQLMLKKEYDLKLIMLKEEGLSTIAKSSEIHMSKF
jgi:hypothetical protein